MTPHRRPNSPPPRSDGRPLPPLEFVELAGRFYGHSTAKPIPFRPAEKVDFVELTGRTQQLVERFAAAWQSLAAGGFADGGVALLHEFREHLKNPRLWPPLDAAGPPPPAPLADQLLATAGAKLAVRWSQSLIEWQRAAAQEWLRPRWAAVWDDLPPGGQRLVAELLDQARRTAEAKYEASLAVAARLGAAVTPPAAPRS